MEPLDDTVLLLKQIRPLTAVFLQAALFITKQCKSEYMPWGHLKNIISKYKK